MAQFYKLSIENIVSSTPSSVIVTFTIPSNLQETFSFIPGQYINIKALVNGQEVRRSYSICNAPTKESLSVGIKKVDDGTFSVYANTHLKVGDTLEVSAPEGRFTFAPNANSAQNIALFAAGSGITPIMSILTTGLDKEPNSNFVLVFGNQSSSETMFFRELQNLKEQYPNRLTIHYLFSRSNEEGSLFGRIESSTVNYILKNKHKDLNFDAFYLCGPEGMIQSVQEALTENNIDPSVIHYELFTTSTDDAETTSVDIPEGKTQVSGVVDDEAFSFVMDASDRVLDAALENDVDAPYSCQGGICSSCIARVKEGSVEMVKNQILTDAELAEGLILTCQSLPTSSTLVIDYDDV